MGARSLLENGELRKDLPREFGRLKYIRIAGFGKGREPLIECSCKCGAIVVRCWQHLRSGRTTSCGCLKHEATVARLTTHGASKTVEHKLWEAMIERCENRNNKHFGLYGGRGIKVCARWRESFAAFLSDMGKRPSTSHSLDRFPNTNGNYEPSNVRWATSKQQGRNKRNNRLLEFNGETLCASEWAERYGLDPSALGARLRLGWSIEAAITTPISERIIELNGERISLTKLAARLGLRPSCLSRRLDRGWSLEEAIATPSTRPAIFCAAPIQAPEEME